MMGFFGAGLGGAGGTGGASGDLKGVIADSPPDESGLLSVAEAAEGGLAIEEA